MELKRFAAPFKLLWSRITFSRLTLFYFIFSVSHFAIQLALQIRAYSINAEAHDVIDKMVHEAGTVNASLPFLRGSRLYMCSWIPSNLNTDVADCPIIWNGDDEGDTISNSTTTSLRPTPTTTTSSSTTPTFTPTSSTPTSSVAGGEITSLQDTTSLLAAQALRTASPRTNRTQSIIRRGSEEKLPVFVTGVNGTEAIELSQQCLWALNWPNVVLRNTKREDSVFIAFQFWVLAVSIIALWNESIPHILASLLTHVMATAWGAFQIAHTAIFHADFKRVITNGACKQTILNASYWQARRLLEIPSLTFNGLALIISCALTWNLIKIFGWQTFKRVGASLTINRVYKLVLSLSITILLSLFFMVVTVSLWIDQLMNSGIGDLAKFVTAFKASSFVTLVLLIPWLMTGWFAVRHELHVPMFIFLFLSILYLAGWGMMFFSTTFRWTFTTWWFFSVMASASVFLTLMATILGVICYFNFGKGLTTYLNTADNRVSTDIEKVPFAAFGKHDSTCDFGSKSAFDTTVHYVTFPQAALQRTSEDGQTHFSYSTKSSISSNVKNSYHSRNSSAHSNHSQKQRWIID